MSDLKFMEHHLAFKKWVERILLSLLAVELVFLTFQGLNGWAAHKEINRLKAVVDQRKASLTVAEDEHIVGLRIVGMLNELNGWMAAPQDLKQVFEDISAIPDQLTLHQCRMERELCAPAVGDVLSETYLAPCSLLGATYWRVSVQSAAEEEEDFLRDTLAFMRPKQEDRYSLISLNGADETQRKELWMIRFELSPYSLWKEL